MALSATRPNKARTLHRDESALRNCFAQAFFDTIDFRHSSGGAGPGHRRQLMSRLGQFFILLVIIGFVQAAQAHESRPAYLEINETLPGRYDVLWRTPLN